MKEAHGLVSYHANRQSLLIPCIVIFSIITLLIIIKIGLIVPTRKHNVDALKEAGYFQNVQIESGETIWDTPKSWRNTFANLFKTCDCIYGKAILTTESMNNILNKYNWSEWIISEPEWDQKTTRFNGFEQEIVHPTMFEFDNLKKDYVGTTFLISPDFDRECMNSTFLNPCHCYFNISNKTLFFYIYHD